MVFTIIHSAAFLPLSSRRVRWDETFLSVIGTDCIELELWRFPHALWRCCCYWFHLYKHTHITVSLSWRLLFFPFFLPLPNQSIRKMQGHCWLLQSHTLTHVSHWAVWLFPGFSTSPEDWHTCRHKELFTDCFILFAVMMSFLRAPLMIVCFYAFVRACGSVHVCVRRACVRTRVCVYMHFMQDEDSYRSDRGILLPSIEPQETELIEIFIVCPDTNVQISCSCIIKQTLRNKKIEFGWSENHREPLTQCIYFQDVTVRNTLFTE